MQKNSVMFFLGHPNNLRLSHCHCSLLLVFFVFFAASPPAFLRATHTLRPTPQYNTQRNNNLYTGHPISRGKKVTGRSGGRVLVPLVFSWSFEFFVVGVVVFFMSNQPPSKTKKKEGPTQNDGALRLFESPCLAAPKKNGWNLPTSNRWIIDPPLSVTSAVLRWIHETLAGVAAQISVDFFWRSGNGYNSPEMYTPET